MLFYNPKNGKRYSQSMIEGAFGPVDSLDLKSLGIYPLNDEIPGRNKTFYTYFNKGVIGSAESGFAIDWGMTERKLEEVKPAMKAALAAKRYAVEAGGIIVGGKRIITDRDSQYMISGAVNAVGLNPAMVVKFKTADGFIELNKDAIIFLATAVANHVQACFAREADLTALIDNSTTFEELKSIYDNDLDSDWPS